MKTRFLWMILKISLPSGRHREDSKLNHFDKFLYFLPQRVGSEKGQKLRLGWNFYFVPQGVEHEKPVFMRFSRKYLVFGSGSEPFLYAYLTCGSENGAILEPVFYLLWFSGAILEPNPIHGIKIDAILITSSLIPSRLSHLARVIFKKFISSTYSQWGKSFIKVFLKNFSNYFVAARESIYCPFTYSHWERSF